MLMLFTLIMCLISPVFVRDTATHEESFNKNERKNSNDKDQRNNVRIGFNTTICLW